MKLREIAKVVLVLATVVLAVWWWQRSGERLQKQRATPPPRPVRFGDEMVRIPEGEFAMGSEDGPDYERPVHVVKVNSFWIDKTEVTVKQFRGFVKDTGYVSDAEKFGWSGVFDLAKKEWGRVDGANWKQPDGPGHVAAENEPVRQV